MIRTSRRLLLLFALTILTSSVAFATRVERLIDAWQPSNYVVSLTLNDQLSEIVTGSARIDVLVLKETSVIDLDFGEMTTNSVKVDSKPAQFTHQNGKLEVQLAEAANPGTANSKASASDRSARIDFSPYDDGFVLLAASKRAA